MRKILCYLILALVAANAAFSQSYTIQTFAGGGLPQNIPGLSANLGEVRAVAVNAAGSVFIALIDYAIVVRMDSSGILTPVAGNGIAGFSGDNGPAVSAQLSNPEYIAVDSEGNLYIADTGNNRVRKVSDGVITTVAGNGTRGFSGDNGPATSAQMFSPWGLAVDKAGSLYIAERDGSRIRKVTNGVITTVAGTGVGGFTGDGGPATSAQISGPYRVALDAGENLYIADSANYRIRKISNGVITTVAGNGTRGFSGDGGPATSAQLNYAYGIAFDAAGDLYIADSENHRVRKVVNGVISTVAGTGNNSFGGDNGLATGARLNDPYDIAFDTSGNLYIADTDNHRVRKVANGVITTVAGGGTQSYADGFGGDGGPATSAQLNGPAGLAVDAEGAVYLADALNQRIRKVANRVITTVAGNGTDGFSGDGGPATSAQLSFSTFGSLLRAVPGIALDASGNLYIADEGNDRIRKVENGVITTVAGNGTGGFSGDGGPATSARLSGPASVAVDAAGNLYIADRSNSRVRKVSNGVITTVAGNGTNGFSGDGGPATDAQLDNPIGVAVDSAGNIYITTGFPRNGRLRKVSSGVITTIAGGGSPTPNGTAPTDVFFIGLYGIAVDSAGSVYFAGTRLVGNSFDDLVEKLSDGVLTPIAGGGSQIADGIPATSAKLSPGGLATNAAGGIYVSGNNCVYLLSPPGSSCSYSVSPVAIQAQTSGGSLAIEIQTAAACSWTVSGAPSWITLSSATSGTGPSNVFGIITANTGVGRQATLLVAGQPILVTQQAAAAFVPVISSVANAFGGASTIAPNTWVEIKGSNLTSNTRTWRDSDFVNGQMPTVLDGVSVTIGGVNAYVYYISGNQLNVLTPPNLQTGPVSVQVTTNGTASAAFTAQAQPYSLSLFVYNGGPYVVAVRADASRIGPLSLFPGLTTPAKPGEIVLLFANGFGPTSSPIVSGSPLQSGSLPALPVIRIGGIMAAVLSATLSSPGLYQFNVVVPVSAPDGDNAITVTYNSAATQAGTLLTIQK